MLPRFLIAAAHKSSGKTVVSTGIAAALAARGQGPAVFKKGPDYIDPMWLARAAGRPAYNLDFNTMSGDEIRALFRAKAAGAVLSLIEANKGLFDGVAADGSDSNAALAGLLQVPVVLVVDTKGMTRGIAPLLRGYVAFDPATWIAGVVLNKTGGSRHEAKLRAAVETYTDLPVLGAIGTAPELDLSERHLGLTVPADTARAGEFVAGLGRRIAQSVDLDALVEVARSAPGCPDISPPAKRRAAPRRGPPARFPGLRIGIARDAAFTFYYPDDLEAFTAAGVELVPFDTLHDRALPDVDGLFIGGGFPEVHAAALAANGALRAGIRRALEAGLPGYAECGGLMYLCRSLGWRGESFPMVGFFEAETVLQARPQGRGYVRFAPERAAPWPDGRAERRAHEFHYARLEPLSPPVFGRRVTRGHGIDGQHDALVRRNTMAGFIHLRHTAQSPWVTEFLGFVAAAKARRGAKLQSS